MLRKMLRAKIHRATVTRCDPDYVGSITVDAELLRASGIAPNEAVQVLDIDNGARLETYVIRGEPGSGAIEINGAAARLVQPGHKVIIVCYGYLMAERIEDHVAKVVLVDEDNRLTRTLDYTSDVDETTAAIHA